MESALQYQITFEYNRTALPSNVTDAETNRITAAWDIMQIEVNIVHCRVFIVYTPVLRFFSTQSTDVAQDAAWPAPP